MTPHPNTLRMLRETGLHPHTRRRHAPGANPFHGRRDSIDRRRAKAIGCSLEELHQHDAAGHWRCSGKRAGIRTPAVTAHWVTDEPRPSSDTSERCSSCRGKPRAKATEP